MPGLIDYAAEGGVDAPDVAHPKVVLISGWSFDSSMWRCLIDNYVKVGGDPAGIHCLDWQVFGHWLFDDTISPEVELCRGSNAFWLGWSLGGGLLLEALARKKIRSRKSMIVSASPRFLQDETTGWAGVPKKNWLALYRQVGRSPEAALSGFDSWLSLPAGYGRQHTATSLQQGLDWLATIDRRHWLAVSHAPIHWVYGSEDPLMPSMSWSERYRSPLQQVTRLQGEGHALPWDRAQFLSELLMESGIADV